MHSSVSYRDLEDPITTAASALEDSTAIENTVSETNVMEALVGEKTSAVSLRVMMTFPTEHKTGCTDSTIKWLKYTEAVVKNEEFSHGITVVGNVAHNTDHHEGTDVLFTIILHIE